MIGRSAPNGHLIEIETYIEAENPTAARTVVDHILVTVERLAQFPFTGKIGRQQGIRELVLSRFPYTIFYRVKPTKIQIVRGTPPAPKISLKRRRIRNGRGGMEFLAK